MSVPDVELRAFLQDSGLAGPHAAEARWTALSGGVSSDIWRVDLPGRAICIKRALPKLKVSAEWAVPIERNTAEWDYLQWVHGCLPGRVPEPIVRDPARHVFAMSWLGTEQHALWKSCLMAGQADPGVAANVGDLLGQIHAISARDAEVATRFANHDTFHAIRLEPYLLAVARVHPDLTAPLQELVMRSAMTRRVLVHGDVSPKNILVGPSGPILLDAECACFGDPAFDLAFCLNHLILKQRVITQARAPLAECFSAFARAYFNQVDWEPRSELETRTARLLPALALARVDGKSPVEYLDAHQRDSLVTAARPLIRDPPPTLAAVREALFWGNDQP